MSKYKNKSEEPKIIPSARDNAHETALHKALKQHIIVNPLSQEQEDPNISQTKTIQEAINLAQDGGIIKISPGLYKENIVINKPGIRLEPKEKSGDIIIFVQRGPAVIIDLKPGEKCFIFGIKLCHSGFNEEDIMFKQMEYTKHINQQQVLNDQKEQNIEMAESKQLNIQKQISPRQVNLDQSQKSIVKLKGDSGSLIRDPQNTGTKSEKNLSSLNESNQFQSPRKNIKQSTQIQQSKKSNLYFQKIASRNKLKISSNHLEQMSEEQLKKEKENLELYCLDNNIESICQSIDAQNTLIQHFIIQKNVNTIILVWGGKLYLEDCNLSLNFIMTTFQQLLPAITVNSYSDILVNRCEIKGNKKHGCIGILLKKSDAIIKDSIIHNHMLGAIHIWGEKKNRIKIQNNQIKNCLPKGTGIVSGGIDSKIVIEGNEIQKNYIGINVGISNQAQIQKNKLYHNFVGIEVVSGDPLIFNNVIERNLCTGIFTRTYNDFRCDGVIKRNECIKGNKEYGIVCQGYNNKTRIEKNENISFNKKCAIKIEDQAHIFIHRNNIFKNLGQGILIVETASAVIEQNKILDNLKANIALGGLGSQNTLICENKISGGRCEGIFLIDASECWILRNQIYENNDGIIMVTSIPWISNNQIIKNKSNGLMLIKDSRPTIEDNLIEHNNFIGLFIRDKSRGIIKKNIIQGNYKTNLLVEKKQTQLENILQENSVCYPKNKEDQFSQQQKQDEYFQSIMKSDIADNKTKNQADENQFKLVRKATSRFEEVKYETYKQREERNKKINKQIDGDIRIPQNYKCTLI